jgi:hypothetical protein
MMIIMIFVVLVFVIFVAVAEAPALKYYNFN